MNTPKNNEKPGLEIIEVNSLKIIFKAVYAWAFCLNANQENKFKYYSLPLNFLNCQKIQKIVPNYSFPTLSTEKNSNFQLRVYQQEDVKFLSQLKSAAIFSEMRTGKTPTALMTFQQWPVSNLLIITPAILQQHWQRSVEEWLDKPAYIITYLEPAWRFNFYQNLLSAKEWILIVSKDTFKIDSAYFQKLKKRKGFAELYGVIVDEAHFLRNYQSQQSKSIYVLREAPYKLVLTGTPVVNHHTDIFGILKFLYPATYSSYWKFAAEYFQIHKSEFHKRGRKYKVFQVKDFKNSQLKLKLQNQVAQISVNRRQKEVLPWLPPIIYQKEYLLMGEEQQKVYSEWQTKWSKYQPLEVLAKLKTLTLYPPELGFQERGSKISYLVNYLKDLDKKSPSLVIFSTRSETFLEPLAQALAEQKIELGLITGKTNYQTREKLINNFQKGELNILLCNIQSAGVGLNLSRAETIIFADRSYSPADNEQAEARFLPPTNEETHRVRLIVDLICKGTIDEKILRLLKRKEDIIKILNTNPSYFFD